jgi:Cytochrome c
MNLTMKKVLKFLKWTGIGLAALILLLIVYVQVSWDKKHDAPYPEISASSDSSLIARGAYLANGIAHCGGCHASSLDDARAFEEGKQVNYTGGFEIPISGLGTFPSPNLTSDKETGIGNYSDAEIARAIRYGVKKNGRALFPFMAFQGLSDEDLTAIISYIRTLPPVHNKVKPTEYGFMYKAIVAFGLMKPEGPKETPPKSVTIEPTVEYGKYLALHVGNCRNCHTEFDPNTGKFIGKDFSGKAYFEADAFTEGYSFLSTNLTPHKETGVIANWTEEQFITRFKLGRIHKGSPMPWGAFSRMSDLELKALYRFFQSLEPVDNKIEQVVFAPGEKPKK